MNNVSLTGRTTDYIEVRYTQSQKAVTRFTLAVNRDVKKDDGTREADFITCVAWGKTAELLGKYVQKGDRIGVVGRIQTGSYEKDGRKIYTTEVIVEKLEFLQNKREEPHEEPQSNDFVPLEDTDDDLPF